MKSLYEKRAPRWAHAVALVLTAALTAGFIDVVFLPDIALLPLETEPTEWNTAERALFGFFTLIGLFLTGVFLWRLIRNPAYFRLGEEGFEYAPGGVSTGLVRWEDVEKIDYTSVKTGGPGGPVTRRVLGIFLRDPHAFIARHPTAMGALFEARRFESGTPLVFQAGEFGRDHDRVVALMRTHWERVKSRGGR